MKKNAVSVICLLLSLLMMLPMTSCADAPVEDGTAYESAGDTAAETDEPETMPVERVDYGKEFTVLYCHDTYPAGYFFITEDTMAPGNDMDDAVYERLVRIKDYLGVDVVPVDGGNFLEYGGPFKRTVSSGDDEYQMIMTHTYLDVTNFITENYLRDFKDVDGLNLDAPYWNARMMEEDSLDGHYFLGYNDFCLASCHLLIFNKDIAKLYPQDMDGIYDEVRNQQWTLDSLMTKSELVAQDNGDGKWTSDDVYGFAGLNWMPMVSFTLACDIRVIDKNEDDELYLSPMEDNAERIVDMTTKLFNFAAKDCTYMWGLGSGDEVDFASGHALFMPTTNFSLVDYKGENVRFGVLPYPKYDAQQADYRVMNWNGMLGIPTTVRDEKMVADSVEMLAYFSAPVKTAFFERLLGLKVAEAPDDAEMLELIWSHQTNDVGMIFSNSSIQLEELFYAVPRLIMAGNDGYAAFYKQRSKGITNGLGKIYKKLRKTKR